jgi:hypothetical protein
MQEVPTQAIANQSIQVQLADQACTLNVYQLAYGLFMDVYVNGALVVGGVVCQDANRIVRSLYLGFHGDLMWADTQGSDDPVYTGLGTRFRLIYVEVADLPEGEG